MQTAHALIMIFLYVYVGIALVIMNVAMNILYVVIWLSILTIIISRLINRAFFIFINEIIMILVIVRILNRISFFILLVLILKLVMISLLPIILIININTSCYMHIITGFKVITLITLIKIIEVDINILFILLFLSQVSILISGLDYEWIILYSRSIMLMYILVISELIDTYIWYISYVIINNYIVSYYHIRSGYVYLNFILPSRIGFFVKLAFISRIRWILSSIIIASSILSICVYNIILSTNTLWTDYIAGIEYISISMFIIILI